MSAQCDERLPVVGMCLNRIGKDWTFDALAPETLQRIIADCINFQTQATGPLVSAYADENGYEDIQAGRDFWLTRQGHATGFWDRRLGTAGEALTGIAGLYGELLPHLGDDGLIYF